MTESNGEQKWQPQQSIHPRHLWVVVSTKSCKRVAPSTNGQNLPVIHEQQTEEDGRDFVNFFRDVVFFTLVNEVLTAKSTIHLEPQLSTNSTRVFFNLDLWLSYTSIYKRNVRMQFDWLSRLEILVLLERQSSSLNINKERSCDQPWIAVTLILPLATAMHEGIGFFMKFPRPRMY